MQETSVNVGYICPATRVSKSVKCKVPSFYLFFFAGFFIVVELERKQAPLMSVSYTGIPIGDSVYVKEFLVHEVDTTTAEDFCQVL